MGMTQLQSEGDFRARVMKYGLFKAESGSVAVNINFEILEAYDHEEGKWVDWRGEDVACEGAFWIIKKDGTINETQVESLIENCGWSGLISDISDGQWHPEDCQITVKEDTYKNVKRYKASFINGYESTPGGMGNISAEKAREIDNAFGSGLRAIAGNVKAKKPPAGGPKSPAKKPAMNGGPGAGDPPWSETEATQAAT